MFGVSKGFYTYEDRIGLNPQPSRQPLIRLPSPSSGALSPLDKVQQGPASPVQGEEEDLQRLPNRYAVKILKKIPHGSREVAARKLALVVEAAVAKNDQSSWNCFLRFATHCLRAPKRLSLEPGQRISEQIRAESHPPPVPSHLQPHQKWPKTCDPLEALALHLSLPNWRRETSREQSV